MLSFTACVNWKTWQLRKKQLLKSISYVFIQPLILREFILLLKIYKLTNQLRLINLEQNEMATMLQDEFRSSGSISVP